MQTKNIKDFDAFFAEHKKVGGPIIKLFDKEYHLPGEVPALILLETHAMYKAGVEEIPEAKQLEMAFALLGYENVTEWCGKGLTMDQLSEIITWAMKEMTGLNDDVPAKPGSKKKKKRQTS